MSTSSLTFEQQRELLAMQIEHERFKLKAELDRNLAVGKICQEKMQARFDFENRLETDREGASAGISRSSQSTFLGQFWF